MENTQGLRQSLFSYLTEKGIQFSRVISDGMIEKAVAKFSFDSRVTPCILYGPFQDKRKEIISIAHEAGHVTIYKKMSKEKVRTYLCSMFAAYGIGLSKISSTGQEFILTVEAEASIDGLFILKEVGVVHNDLKMVAKLMNQWYATYEALCQKDVVKKVREKIIKERNAAFLVSP
jgi:hypothetical protein